jgi:hypothetical protein
LLAIPAISTGSGLPNIAWVAEGVWAESFEAIRIFGMKYEPSVGWSTEPK